MVKSQRLGWVRLAQIDPRLHSDIEMFLYSKFAH